MVMKKTLVALLAIIIVLPAFLQVMPHGVDHALHQTKVHSSAVNHGHNHDDHGHATHDDMHHAINLDVVTFYDEYLHVNLQTPDQVIVELPDLNTENISFDIIAHNAPVSRHELSSVQSRSPPDWRSFRAENTPLYLSTLRFRI